MTTINVTLDLNDDFFEDEDMSLGAHVQNIVISGIKNKILGQVNRECMLAISNQAKKYCEEKVPFIADAILAQQSQKIMICEWRGEDEDKVPLDEYIADRFSRQDFNERIELIVKKHIDRKAFDSVDEMKSRYDNIFAAHVVDNMKKMDLLKDDVAKMLSATPQIEKRG